MCCYRINAHSACCCCANVHSACCYRINVYASCYFRANICLTCYFRANVYSACYYRANVNSTCCYRANVNSTRYYRANVNSACCCARRLCIAIWSRATCCTLTRPATRTRFACATSASPSNCVMTTVCWWRRATPPISWRPRWALLSLDASSVPSNKIKHEKMFQWACNCSTIYS